MRVAPVLFEQGIDHFDQCKSGGTAGHQGLSTGSRVVLGFCSHVKSGGSRTPPDGKNNHDK